MIYLKFIMIWHIGDASFLHAYPGVLILQIFHLFIFHISKVCVDLGLLLEFLSNCMHLSACHFFKKK